MMVESNFAVSVIVPPPPMTLIAYEQFHIKESEMTTAPLK